MTAAWETRDQATTLSQYPAERFEPKKYLLLTGAPTRGAELEETGIHAAAQDVESVIGINTVRCGVGVRAPPQR